MRLHHKTLFRFLTGTILAVTVLLLTVLPAQSAKSIHSPSYSSGIFCRRLNNVILGDNPRANIVNVAMSQIGYCEGDSTEEISGCTPGTNNYTEYGLWYNNLQEKPGGFEKAAWCAMFVSWCAQQAGISSEVMYYHAYTVFGLSWFQEQNLAYTRQQVEDGFYLPQPGDIVYFKSARNNSIVNHVGIVVRYENGVLYAVEGNTNDTAYSTTGGVVCLKSYDIEDTFIRYVCSPNYT